MMKFRSIKFKSIRASLLSIILPLVIIGMISISIISYFYSKSIINNEIAEKMNSQINFIAESIEKNLSNHNQLAVTLAKSVEASLSTANEETYLSTIKKFVTTNNDTFGSGIWFEPYGLNSEEKYFGPYAHKENGQVYLTMEYSNDSYNYFEYDWYINGKNAVNGSAWSEPYYDETSNITMITTSVPFSGDSQEVLGVVTADIDLNSIQNLIAEVEVGKTGWAFLLNNDGLYIADKNLDKIMKDNILMESNQSLVEMGSKILETKYGNGDYLDNGEKFTVHYSQIPQTGWIIGLTISQSELYAPLKSLMTNMFISFIISLILVTIGVIIYATNLTKKMTKLKETAEFLADGDFSVSTDIDSVDEIGVLSNSFNSMVHSIKSLLSDAINISNEVSNSATNLAATSEETAASSEEIARTIEEIARGAEDQANDAESSSIIATSLDEKFRTLKINSSIMYENAHEANKANSSGTLAVKELIEKTNSNNQSMVRIEKAIQELNQKSNNIGEILETISSIAEQTNLLALNASIEAARAGNAGRGFAVVANEIRKLAEGSKNAASKIVEIVESLQLESNNTVSIMSEVKSISEEQTKAVESVNLTFNAIYESIKKITAEIEGVNSFIDILNEDKDKIVSSIENISAVSQETAAASEEITASMEQQVSAIDEVAKNAEILNELSINLNEKINKFKI